ncbi:transcriptional repressor NrdR [Candidatus Peregrinibacteria bacterium]|nr:transcriptional repressor NrdR [Candidatus Peregrinibacteria bacterium]
MQCIKCKNIDTRVIDSRVTDEGRSVRRRRECEKCLHRFTTFERIETTGLIVVKNNGTREPFSREKLEHSVWIACSKRPVTREQVEETLARLLEGWGGGKEITSQKIGEDLMVELKKLDHVAFIRFASVYRSFKDVEDFKDEISKLFSSPQK